MEFSKGSSSRKFFGFIVGIGLVLSLLGLGNIIETVDATEITVIQDWYDGELHWYKQPGVQFQWFGKVTRYPKSFQFWFSESDNEPGAPIRVRFNDNGHAMISGSARIDMPIEDELLTKIHTRYGSYESLHAQLIRPVMEKAIYTTGPLMSSTQSASERRPELLSHIENQALNGVYSTITKKRQDIDQLTGQTKLVDYVEILPDSNDEHGWARVEISPLKTFGIKMYNVSINSVKYDESVEAQIQQQQQSIMGVQIAIAEAKKAEQAAITAEQNGKARAAEARWAKEAEKAAEVTVAEKLRDVAKLSRDEAEFIKQKEILLGQGEAQRKALVMQADGALKQKLDAYIEVQKAYAEALKNYGGAIVPQIQSGGNGQSNGGNGFEAFMNLMSAKVARELGFNPNPSK